MNKKGEVLTFFAAAMIIITISAAIVTIKQGDKVYVGDKIKGTFIEYNKCPLQINQISESNRIIFESINQAESQGYAPREGCV